MMLETNFECSTVNVGIVGVVIYSPEALFGIEAHIFPAARTVDGYKISAKPFWELPLTKGPVLPKFMLPPLGQ